jgi:hypothetical protein
VEPTSTPQLQATLAEAEVAAALARAEEAEERVRLVEREANEERLRSAAEAAAEADRLRCELATAHAELLTVSDERDAVLAEKRLLEESAVRAAESEAVEAELRDVCAKLQVRE